MQLSILFNRLVRKNSLLYIVNKYLAAGFRFFNRLTQQPAYHNKYLLQIHR